jgi:hypothetical protein
MTVPTPGVRSQRHCIFLDCFQSLIAAGALGEYAFVSRWTDGNNARLAKIATRIGG